MKTAMLVYGQLRQYEKCMPSIQKYILDVLQPDVFVNVWDTRGHSLYSEVANLDISFSNEKINRDDIIKYYNQVDINIENYDEWKNELKDDYKHVIATEKKSATPKNYKIKLCNQMKRKYEEKYNFKYDCVIVFRPDTIFFSQIPMYVLEDLDCIWQLNPPHLFNKKICHSMFHIMNTRVSDIFEVYYDNLPNLWKLPYIEPGFDTKYDCTRTEYLHFKQHNVRIRAYKKWWGFVETYRSPQDFNNSVSPLDEANEKIIDSIIYLDKNGFSDNIINKLKDIDRVQLSIIVEWCEHYYFISNKHLILKWINS